MNTKQLNEKFALLTDKEKAQLFKALDKKVFANEKKSAAAQLRDEERERAAAEKAAAKLTYKGFFNIFNIIQKETTIFPSIKALRKDADKWGLIGGMTFNQFLRQTKNVGAYDFNEVWNYCKEYQAANDGDKLLILERGQKINDLVRSLRSSLPIAEDLNEIRALKLESLNLFVALGGAPFKVNAKGERKCTLRKGSAKVLFEEFPTLYRTFGVAEYMPEIHKELTAISEEITTDELETAK